MKKKNWNTFHYFIILLCILFANHSFTVQNSAFSMIAFSFFLLISWNVCFSYWSHGSNRLYMYFSLYDLRLCIWERPHLIKPHLFSLFIFCYLFRSQAMFVRSQNINNLKMMIVPHMMKRLKTIYDLLLFNQKKMHFIPLYWISKHDMWCVDNFSMFIEWWNNLRFVKKIFIDIKIYCCY